MPMRVPELQKQFRYESPQVPGARLQPMQVQTNAAMFGAESGRQMEKAGYMLQRGADQFAHLVNDYNTTKAREAASQMQQDFLGWQTEAAKKVGKDGISAGQDYDAWAQQRMDELSKGMNEVQRGRFQSLVGERMALQKRWAEGYAQEQDGVYKMSTWKTEMSVAGNTIATNPNDTDMVRQAVEQIKNSSFNIAKYKGMDDQAGAVLMREHVAEYLGGTIHNLIQQGEIGSASALMKQHGEQLGGAAMGKLNVAMTREMEHQAVKARAAEADRIATLADNAARELHASVKRGDINPSDAMLKMRDIPNAKVRREVQGNFSELLRIDEQIAREAEHKGRVEASDAFDKLESPDARWNAVQEAKRLALAADATPQQKAYSKHMQTLYKDSVEFEDAGIKSGSNPAAHDAATAMVRGGAGLDDLKASEHWGKLSPVSRRTMEKAVKDGLQAGYAELTRLYNDMYSQRYNKEYSAKDGQGDREIFLQGSLENIRETKRGDEPGYYQKLVDRHFMETKKPGGTLWGTKGIYGQQSRTEGGALPVMSEDERRQIESVFNANPDVKKAWVSYAQKNWGKPDLNYAMRAFLLQQNLKLTGRRAEQ